MIMILNIKHFWTTLALRIQCEVYRSDVPQLMSEGSEKLLLSWITDITWLKTTSCYDTRLAPS